MVEPELPKDAPMRFIDAGASKPGQVKKAGRDKTEFYECLRCETKQIESILAKNRASRVRCRHCGNTVYPVTFDPAESKEARKCSGCGCKLRAGNPGTRCSPCKERE